MMELILCQLDVYELLSGVKTKVWSNVGLRVISINQRMAINIHHAGGRNWLTFIIVVLLSPLVSPTKNTNAAIIGSILGVLVLALIIAISIIIAVFMCRRRAVRYVWLLLQRTHNYTPQRTYYIDKVPTLNQ